MLNEFRTQKLSWDKADARIHQVVSANSGDANGRKLNVQIVNNGIAEDLTGTALNLAWQTKDGVNYGLDAFEVIDVTKGIFEITYTTDMLTNTGVLRASLVFVDTIGTVESNAFPITVNQSNVDAAAVQSENSFSTLTTALVEVNGWNGRIDTVEQDFKDRADVMEVQYPVRLNDLDAQLVDKANLTDVASIATGTPLFADSIAGMTDTTRLYANTTDGLIYQYNSNSLAFESTIVQYQSTGIEDGTITHEKVSPTNHTVNVLNKDELITGFYSGGLGTSIKFTQSTSWSTLPTPIPVNQGDIINWNLAYGDVFYIGVDADDIVVQVTGTSNPVSPQSRTVIQGVVKFYTTVFNTYIDTAMITINDAMPLNYVPFKISKTLDWLEYKNESIRPEHFAPDTMSDAIELNSISATKIDPSNVTVNVFDIDNLNSSKFYYNVVGSPIEERNNSLFSGCPIPIVVSEGDVVRFNRASENVYYVGVDDNDVVVQVGSKTTLSREITVVAGVVKFYTNVLTDYVDEAMITINNPMPLIYTPRKLEKTLDWLSYKDASIELNHLSPNIQLSTTETGFEDKKIVWYGTSIDWQDGKPYGSTGLIARGWQTHFKEQLGITVDNQGVSGSCMANGTRYTLHGYNNYRCGKNIELYGV